MKACTLIKRLSPPPLTPLNHFGILVELLNGERFLIHNSPGNKGHSGTEIVVYEKNMSKLWEQHQQWEEIEKDRSIDQLIEPVQYTMLRSNCFHSVNRIWNALVPEVDFNIFYDPKLGYNAEISLEDQIRSSLCRFHDFSLQDLYLMRRPQKLVHL